MRRPSSFSAWTWRSVMKVIIRGLSVLLLAALMNGRPLAATASCGDLAGLTLPGATITLAQPVDAGVLALPPSAAGAPRPAGPAEQTFNVPRAFCRVAATLRPSTDSDIHVEIWMPVTNWNGKFQAVGNGAFNGTIAYGAMITALGRGYATSSTDTGHAGGSASFALGQPEKVIDFGWRAVHEMTVIAKKIIATYYDAAAKFSYW